MKKALKSFLQRRNLYYPLKYSAVFRVYQTLFKRDVIKKERSEIEFYSSFLTRCKLIFDIGAYDGHKTAAFLTLADKIVSCEPDTASFEILKTRYRNKSKKVFLENVAVAETTGKREFFIHQSGSAFNTLSEKWKETLEKDNVEKWDEKIKFGGQMAVATTTLDALIAKYGQPDFIKIDVEGYEEQVLNGLSHPISYLSFEALLPDGYTEFKNCIDRIEQLDKEATYNAAAHEKLLLPAFVTRGQLMDWLHKNPVMHLEVIVKMNP